MNTKYSAILLSGLILSTDVCPCIAALHSFQKEPVATEIGKSQWKGKKVAFLGDSITDKAMSAQQKITGSIWKRC